jgi:carbon-monoxide dehydrogenase medium subunit
VAESGTIRKTFGALAEGAGNLGSPLIRNLATIGGNLVTARPAADFPPPLMAYGAEVVLKSSKGERSVPLDSFFLSPGETVIEPEEIMTAVYLETPSAGSGAGYFKLGVRQTLEISLLNVAAYIALENDGVIGTARIFLGSVAPTPIRAPSAEKILSGEKPSEKLFKKAGEAAAKDSKPIDDFRASAAYKRDMVEVLTGRALNKAYEEAGRS